MAVMTSTEFVNKLMNVLRFNTVYVMGGQGQQLKDAAVKNKYINNYAHNQGAAAKKAILNASSDTFAFDCVGLIKSVLWGFTGDYSDEKSRGGSRYASNGIPDFGISTAYYDYSSEQSTTFDLSTMMPGEILILELDHSTRALDHVGVYIGDGLAIEATAAWENKVIITSCNCTIAGYHRRNWTGHAKLTKYIEYPKSGEPQGIQSIAGPANPVTAGDYDSRPSITERVKAAQVAQNMTGRTLSNAINSQADLDYATSIVETNFEVRYAAKNDESANSSEYSTKFNVNTLRGIEGIPYQFLPSVDRRIDTDRSDSRDDNYTLNVEELSMLGRKYVEKIVTQIPLLFLAPCNPLFMSDFTEEDKNIMKQSILNPIESVEELLSGSRTKSGRFYTAEFAYTSYYSYLNIMLRAVSLFLGIGDETVTLGNGTTCKLKEVNWENDINSSLSSAYLPSKNLMFYIDSIDTINESFSNSTRQSSIASLINGFSDQAKEIDFLFGTGGDSLASSIKGSVEEGMSAISGMLSETAGNLAGGIVESLMEGGINSIINGGKIVFPEMWDDSSFDRSYSISIKLRSPDNDSLSIFMNVLKPYCKILALTLPHMIADNVNTYRTPFIVKAYCKGLFNIDLGIISGLSVSKGATCAWNDDGLPTQIDLDIDIKDLYSQLTMTGLLQDSDARTTIPNMISGLGNELKQVYNIASNTAYMDFLANMAGLNINQTEWYRKPKMLWDLARGEISQFNAIQTSIGNRLTDAVSNTILRFYNFP